MALVRMLYFCAAKFDIKNVMIVHIAGSNNTIADALSRFQATRFYQPPLAAPHPDNILAWPTQFWTDSSMNINP